MAAREGRSGALSAAAGDAALDPLPTESLPATPPDRWWGDHVGELRWQVELGRLLVDPVFRGRGIPWGDGAPALLIPGFMAGDTSLKVMRGWLERIGYNAHASGIAFNVDCSDRTLDALERRLEALAGESGRQVALLGHSRGGHFVKALARRRPELVCSAISLGAGLDRPFDISVPTRAAVAAVRAVHSVTSDRIARNGCFTTACRCRFVEDFSAPFPDGVPLTSIYTRSDGVVRWEACVVDYAHCVEVAGSHIGLACNRDVYRHVARTLARETAA